MNVKSIAVLSSCIVITMALGGVTDFAARADDIPAAIYSGISQLRQSCGPLGDDPRLTSAAQRHADDLVRNGVDKGHIGSDGSSPQGRIVDAGYIRPRYTSEIIFWGSGSYANPSTALDFWMQSPPHRSVILDCGLTATGFAVAWDGNKMIAVGDFATP